MLQPPVERKNDKNRDEIIFINNFAHSSTRGIEIIFSSSILPILAQALQKQFGGIMTEKASNARSQPVYSIKNDHIRNMMPNQSIKQNREINIPDTV